MNREHLPLILLSLYQCLAIATACAWLVEASASDNRGSVRHVGCNGRTQLGNVVQLVNESIAPSALGKES